MRVFSVPASMPFLRSVIAALVDGRLIDGFEARAHPERLTQATLYLPTRRAGRMAREIFLDELNTDAVLLPRIVALGDIESKPFSVAKIAAYMRVPRTTVIRRLDQLQRWGLIDRHGRRYYMHEKALNSLIAMRSYQQVRRILSRATQELTVLDTLPD